MANKHDHLKTLSTGHLSAVLLQSKHGASIHFSRIGAWLNLEKAAKEQTVPIKTKIEEPSVLEGYRPPKKKVVKLSIKAIVSPKTLLKTLPRPLMREGMRIMKEGN